ncbi:protein Wnt-6 [Cyanistes caeruleus]|uniref:protein Wnt-6 n=1 Tax=Cyanistes caeruleus TaxID=156563 RepID=UPI000CDA59D9|nr:protein Wnt-6 [Cyanistes caeruleus]
MLPFSRTQLGLFFILLCPANIIGLWWAVGSPLVMDPNSICRKTKRLAGKQAELCQLEPEIVQEVAKGTKLGVRECQYQFRFRRWNCTSHSKYFGKILQQGKASASSASHFPKRPQPGHAPPWDSSSRSRLSLGGCQAVSAARQQHREHGELARAAVSLRGRLGCGYRAQVCRQVRVHPLPSAEQRGQLSGAEPCGAAGTGQPPATAIGSFVRG